MDERDVERMLRDVVMTQGLRVTFVRVQRATTGWLVTIMDEGDQTVSTSLPSGSPVEMRTVFSQWLETLP